MKRSARRALDKVVEKTLRDAGITSPPVRLADLMKHLDLHQEFYNLSDPGFLDKTKHKLVVGGQQLVKILGKIELQAAWFPEEKRVVIDSSLPELKRVWAGFHETAHRICPGHHGIFALGDTAQTLQPDFHEKLEAEANYVAAGLMFCGQRFTEDTLDTSPCWDSVKELKDRYRHTLSTTLRRYVGFGPDRAMAMTLSAPPWATNGEDGFDTCRHFVASPLFTQTFGDVDVSELACQLKFNCRQRSGGPVGDFTFPLPDVNGDDHEFRAEAFFNTYDVLTLYVHQRQLKARKDASVYRTIRGEF